MMTMAHPSGLEGPAHPAAPHHIPPPHRSWYVDHSAAAARYPATAADAAAAHLLPNVDHHLNQVGVDGTGSAAFFASQEASRYYHMHQAYENAAASPGNIEYNLKIQNQFQNGW